MDKQNISFSVKAKEELCRVPINKNCCAVAELYGIFLYANTFDLKQIRIKTELTSVAKRITMLIEKVFNVHIEIKNIGQRLVIEINDDKLLEKIMTEFGYDTKPYISCPLNRNMVEQDCCAASFLRGVFLISGSVASPDKKSHLEIKCSHIALCRQVISLMLDLGIEPKMLTRQTSGVIYLKGTAAIEDFLTRMGACLCAMEIMEAKVEKNLRNNINRQVNCETSNLVKTTDASAKQIAAIEKALLIGGIEIFPENLRETVDLRVANPASSLSELALMFDKPMTKSGLSHRLRKIMQISQRLEQKGKE